VGYLPQLLAARSELPLTVREVVAVGRSGLGGLLRPLGRRDWSLVDEWIDRLGLSDLRRQRYGDLSGGEQRKTLLARVMVQQPRLLLLDEPTANLDLAWREEVVSLLEELYRQSHLPMVLICHELEVLPPSCSHALLLENGRVRAYGHPAAVLTDETIADLLSPALAVLRRGRRFAVVPREGGE
jgi:ABC-type Mn2+/Zn2+ transport system ATPase subunit